MTKCHNVKIHNCVDNHSKLSKLPMKRTYLEHKNNAEKRCNKYKEQTVHTMVHIEQMKSCASSKHMYTGADATSKNLYLKQTSVYVRRCNKYELMQ